MLKNNTIKEILIAKTRLKAGEQRAFVMANVINHCKVMIVGSHKPKVVNDAKMITADTMNEALSKVRNDLGNDFRMVVIPDSLITLPILS